MIAPRQFLRVVSILRIMLRYGLDEFADSTRLRRPLNLLRIALLAPRPQGETRPRGERVREALQALGPIFVKFGQTLSTRRDLLPRDVADELARLQDEVPPFPSAEAVEALEKIYRRPLVEVFDRFDEEPLAAASIAQIHAARLPGGADVVVKLLRPGIEKQIRTG